MTDHHWADTRQRAIELFNGETPRAQLEQDIVNVFTRQPALVIAAVEQVGAQYANGTVRSGWAVLRTHVVNAATPHAGVTATDSSEREKRIHQAEQLLRASGPHFPTEGEVEDELFGDRGLLRQWHDDHALRTRMLTVWADLRERSEATSATPEPPPEEERHQTAEQLRKRFRDLQRTPEPALQGRGGGS